MWRVVSQGSKTSLRSVAGKRATRASYSSSARVSEEKVVAIRREDINVWERRAPIAPQHVKELRQKNITVLVQPSTRRAYTMSEYENAGAIITEDLTPASLIMAVKQVPIDILIPNRTYSFFSHTIKAQEGNMPLLDAMLDKNIRLVDYEKMVDAKGQRVAAFGKFAGVGGMINILHGVGLRLLALGHHTPFMYVGATHNYKNSRQARLAIYELGEDIKAGKLPKHFGPLSFVFTGSGNVSKGAQEVFQELPHIYVEPHELKDALQKFDHRTLVATEVSREDYLVPKAGGVFNSEEFDEHPERYRSIFADKIAPYASVIVNGVYWGPRNPRLIRHDDALQLLEKKQTPDKYGGCPDLPHRLIAICDISADLGGSIEFMTECTTIEYPFELYDVKTGTSQLGMAGDGVLVCSIDNLPAQLPREATDYFGKLLLPWIPEMVESNALNSFESQTHLSSVVKNAIICSNGKLTPNYEYIQNLREKQEQAKILAAQAQEVAVKQRVLVLGAGMVVSPLVEYLTRDGSVGVTVVSSVSDEAEHVSTMYDNTSPLVLDVTRSMDRVEKLVKEHDLVVSLLPWTLHPEVAKLCIKHKTNMVTASYESPAMRELHESAKDAGVTILQEIGLDPGIDHLLARDCFHDVQENGGKVVSFVSYCGGLPAPENSENPLRYKFSWSPRGALETAMNGARYIKDGKTVEIQPGHLMEHACPLDMFPGFHLEGYPNRDSAHYVQAYGLQDVHTMLRGTIRYHGFASVCHAMLKLGMFSEQPSSDFKAGKQTSWRKLTNSLLGTFNLSTRDLAIVVHDKIGQNDAALAGIQSLGLLSDEKIEAQGTPIDTLSSHLTKLLAYAPGERDLVLLRHTIGVQWPNGSKEQQDVSLVAYGDPNGYSAMARTVGLPVAIAVQMVLEGEIVHKGSVTPMSRDVYLPIIRRLNAENIRWSTTITKQ